MILMFAVLFAGQAAAQARYRTSNERYYREGRGNYYGLRVGLNLASISSDDLDYDSDIYAGLYFGGVVGLQLARQAPLWLELGLAYSEKGGIARIDGQRVKYRLGYLQFPIALKYDIILSEFRIQPFLGGYLSTGVSGKTKDYRIRQSYSSYDDFNRFDGGLRLGCGVEYQMIYFEIGFDFGLANIIKDDFNTAHSRCVFLNAGVNF